MARLLTVEDDPRIRASLVEAFAEEGHHCDEAGDMGTARARLAEGGYDLVLLDVMLPDGDGWELLREIRERADGTKVIFLSAKHEVAERLHGLTLGAVDYVVKPFDLRELEARVAVALQRVVASELPECFDLRLDPLRRRAHLRGELLDLTPKEFEFLAILLRAKGGVVDRETLFREVWDLPHTDNQNVLDVLVTRLRRKLRARRGPTVYTERGLGYGLAEGETR
ncbi:MAG: response regulator transcription factor [Planctomycetota bacterium]